MTGIMCDSRATENIKGMILKTVVRPAMMYGLETTAMTNRQERQFEVAEMLIFEVTRNDTIRNEHIRGAMKVADLDRRSCVKSE